jgi:phosphatidylinositol glycan class T
MGLVGTGKELSSTQTQLLLGYGQESGGFRINFINNNPSEPLQVLYFDKLPWFLRVYLHTLKANVESLPGSRNNLTSGQNVIETISYQTAIDRKRPSVLELELSLPPSSMTSLTFDFEKTFMWYTEYPPDANKGFDIG